jgi:hypothetical protein
MPRFPWSIFGTSPTACTHACRSSSHADQTHAAQLCHSIFRTTVSLLFRGSPSTAATSAVMGLLSAILGNASDWPE